MLLWQALVLGVVQGLTEFLPVSSSGHLVLFHNLFGMKEPMLAFDIALHAGTLVAILIYFQKEIRTLGIDLWRFLSRCLCPCACSNKGVRPSEDVKGSDPFLWFWILLTLIPTGLIAILFKDYFESSLADLFAVGWQFVVMGALLLLSVKIRPGTRPLGAIGWWRSILIGLAQAAALVPAISRSGSTILTGMLLGIKREDAARFSFLISVPAILAAVLLEVKDGSAYFSAHINEVLIGFLASAISGYAVIKWLMGVIQKGRFYIFGYYCLAVGILSIILAKFVL